MRVVLHQINQVNHSQNGNGGNGTVLRNENIQTLKDLVKRNATATIVLNEEAFKDESNPFCIPEYYPEGGKFEGALLNDFCLIEVDFESSLLYIEHPGLDDSSPIGLQFRWIDEIIVEV